MEEVEKRMKVDLLFPIKEEQQIFIHIGSTDWNLSSYGPVYLCFDNERIRMKYIGHGSTSGQPLLVLVPDDPTIRKVEDIKIRNDSEIYLERIQ